MQQDNGMQIKTTLVMAGFSIACLSSVYWPVLPHPLILTVIVIAACLFHLSAGLIRRLSFVPCLAKNSLLRKSTYSASTLIIGLAVGSLWMASVGYWYLTWQLPGQNNPQNAQFTLLVTEAKQFQARTCQIRGTPQTGRFNDILLQPSLLLYWHSSDNTCPLIGQIIKITARLKRPSGVLNPGAPDKMKRLLSKKVVMTGSVISLVPDHYLAIPTIHQRASHLLARWKLTHRKWSAALLLGDRALLTTEDWELLKRSGTAHLFSISGMHLGLVAVWVLLIAKLILPSMWLVRLTKNQYNVRLVSLSLTVAGCFSYAALASWQLPVVRALILVIIAVALYCSERQISRLNSFLVMVSLCCLLFPFSLFASGFYLSIGAVGFIWLFSWICRPRLSRLSQRLSWAVRLQFILCLFLTPITLLWFGEQSLTAPAINFIAIPVVTLLLPIGLFGLLIGTIFPAPGGWIITIFDSTLGLLMTVVKAMSHWLPTLSIAVSPGAMLTLLAALIIMALPRFKKQWWCAGLLLIPSASQTVAFNPEKWYLHVFDVGQGTALLISRGGRAILIDTGAAFLEQSMLTQQILPALNRLKIDDISHVFISHHDNDHAGGVGALNLLAQVKPTTSVYTSTDRCQRGTNLTLLNISFEAIWPEAGNTQRGNNFSCVLAISDGNVTVLAPGDIERWAEYQLLYSKRLPRAKVLIAPHHGSRTSSGTSFINAVSPDWVVFTQGRGNRWGFPHDDVITRYISRNTHVLQTSQSGYIRFEFSTQSVSVTQHTLNLRSRWYYRTPR